MEKRGLLRTHTCGDLRISDEGTWVTLCGWANKKRDLGSLHFIDLRDKYGLIQLNFSDYTGKLDFFKNVSLESVLQVSGKVKARPEKDRNKDMSTGDIEIEVANAKILSYAQNLPFLPSAKTEATEDLRLKYRYLDLRTKKLQDILKLRAETSMKVRNLLSLEGFIEVETPILYKTTPEGARDYIVPSRVWPKKVYALPQSPQTLKQLLMIGSTDKYFQICKCFRDEDLRADRQPEFSQIDIEVSFAGQDYVYLLIENMLKDIFSLGENFKLLKMTYKEAMEKYGSDKPDQRFHLEHMDVTRLFKSSSFETFSKITSENGLIKALFLPASLGTLSRKDLDALTLLVAPFGLKGVAYVKVTENERSGGIAKFVDDGLYENLLKIKQEVLSKDDKTREEKEGTWFFVASSDWSKAHAGLDVVRRSLGEKFKLFSKNAYAFLWIYDFPLLEFDSVRKRFLAKHHPFTSIKENERDSFMKASKDDQAMLKDLLADAYDVVCNGQELGGGSVRIYDPLMQEKMFEVLGMSAEEVKAQFGFFVDALKYGTPPHAGLAFGLDRMIMLLAGTDDIRDVIAFPKTTSANDLMASAPSEASKAQLDEVHLQWT